jgi:polyhydroxyalkanoate synthesis regulator phasin
MSLFNQMKLAQGMMKNMTPEQVQELMQQAKDSKQDLDGQIRQIVAEEIEKRGLITKAEVEQLMRNNLV